MDSVINESDSKYQRFSKFLIDTQNTEYLDSLSELVRTALVETVDERLKTNDYHIKVNSAIKKGDYNFTGIIYRVSFKCVQDSEDDECSMILKVAPNNESRRIQFHARAAFTREIYTYDVVSIHHGMKFKKRKFQILIRFRFPIDFTSIS